MAKVMPPLEEWMTWNDERYFDKKAKEKRGDSMNKSYEQTFIEQDIEMTKTNHILHLIITLVFFPWFIVWVAIANSNAKKRKRLREKLKHIEVSR